LTALKEEAAMLGIFKKKAKERVVANVRVGKAQGDPAASSHTRGVRRGNARHNSEKEAGVFASADGARASARRSTGINPEQRNPIDPRMPNLPPS
jgi:hypothetical protein